jgi:hypothetical protein
MSRKLGPADAMGIAEMDELAAADLRGMGGGSLAVEETGGNREALATFEGDALGTSIGWDATMGSAANCWTP